jgi:simple sugar transport system ATP-binding protein
MPDPHGGARLELRGITKQYPGVLANDRIDVDVLPGEIHAVLGENGAGKSTLMKVIYGIVKPDAGTIRWEGAPAHVANPAQARKLGIGMVFQPSRCSTRWPSRTAYGLPSTSRTRCNCPRGSATCPRATD